LARRNFNLLVTIIVVVCSFVIIARLAQRVQYKIAVDVDKVTLPYTTKRVADKNMWEDEEKIVQYGEDGFKEIYTYYAEKYVNGKLEERVMIPPPAGKPEERVVKKPVTQIIKYGTKKGFPTGYVYEDHWVDSLGNAIGMKLKVLEAYWLESSGKIQLIIEVECTKGWIRDFDIDHVIDKEGNRGLSFSLYGHRPSTVGDDYFDWWEYIIEAGQKKKYDLIWDGSSGNRNASNYKIVVKGKEIELEKFWKGPFWLLPGD